MELHGVLLQVAGCGILIQGPAGCGKSQLGLELLDRGHRFIADDLIQLQAHEQQIIGAGIGLCGDFLHLRCGLVIDILQTYGRKQKPDQCPVDLVVQQGLAQDQQADQAMILGLPRPRYSLAQLPGSAIVLEALARNWHDQAQGQDAATRLQAQHQALLKQSA